jgi:hypothetical protein
MRLGPSQVQINHKSDLKKENGPTQYYRNLVETFHIVSERNTAVYFS